MRVSAFGVLADPRGDREWPLGLGAGVGRAGDAGPSTMAIPDVGARAVYAIDWTDVFRTDLNRAGQPTPGEMRGFHVVFRLRVQRGGRLAFYDSDRLRRPPRRAE